jgi:hypothetical protein
MPPQPRVQAFVVCREMYESPQSHEFVLVAPVSRVVLPTFPARTLLSVYAHLTDARGRYAIGLRLVDGEGDTVWEWLEGPVVQQADPILPHRVVLYDVAIDFPRPGRYDLVMLANAGPLSAHAIWAQPGQAV